MCFNEVDPFTFTLANTNSLCSLGTQPRPDFPGLGAAVHAYTREEFRLAHFSAALWHHVGCVNTSAKGKQIPGPFSTIRDKLKVGAVRVDSRMRPFPLTTIPINPVAVD